VIERRSLVAGLGILAAPAILRSSKCFASPATLFEQPALTGGVAENFSVTLVQPAYNPIGAFYLHANQPNPYRADHRFLPVNWDAGRVTGLHCTTAPKVRQAGIWVPSPTNPSVGTAVGHTVAQVDGEVVGAYLNSRDLFEGSPGNRMMIAPSYVFASPSVPFASLNSKLKVTLQLQVPAATSVDDSLVSNCYVKFDLLFIDQANSARMTLACGLFANGGVPQHDGSGFDTLTQTAIATGFAAPFSQLVTLCDGSEVAQAQPWRGFRWFAYTVDQSQFAAALLAAAPQAAAYGYTLSLDPADYALSGLHLNAELHYTTQEPATLGWSMRSLNLRQIR
jgi:hypothetical protein